MWLNPLVAIHANSRYPTRPENARMNFLGWKLSETFADLCSSVQVAGKVAVLLDSFEKPSQPPINVLVTANFNSIE